MKPGDLIWQSRHPGGMCLFIGEVDIAKSESGWNRIDEPVLRLLHPSEGLIEDPSYYYNTVDEAEKYGRLRLRYEIKKRGDEVPEWLQKEIEEDESR